MAAVSPAPPGREVAGLRFSVIWVTTFLAFVVLGTCWNLAQPQFTGADELAHFLEGEAVWSGQILPATNTHTPAQVAIGVLHGIRVPLQNYYCVIALVTVSADCANPVTSMSKPKVPTTDYVSREPPLPAFLDGWPIALRPSADALYQGRFIDTLLGAGAFATAVALAAVRRRPFLLLGVVLTTTPSVVAGWGVLGSSQLEIGAATLVWTCATLLIDGEVPTRRFVLLLTLASIFLVLSRPASFVYLGLAAIAILVGSRTSTRRVLLHARPMRIGGALAAVATAFSLYWAAFLEAPAGDFVTVQHLAPLHGFGPKTNYFLSTVQNHWVQSIGAIGNNEYNGPWWMTLGWSFLLAVVVGAGLLWASRRRVLLIVFLGAALLAVPWAVEVAKANTERLQWQGRYDIPTMAGIILLSCSVLDRAVVATPQLRRLATAAITLAGLGQVMEFVGGLRRYAVGTDGSLDPLSWSKGWHPPIPLLALLVAGVLSILAAYVVLGVHQRAVLRRVVLPADPGRQAQPSNQLRTGPTRPAQPL